MRSRQFLGGRWVEAPVMQPPVPVEEDTMSESKPPEDFDALVELMARAIYESDPESGYRLGDGDTCEWLDSRYGDVVWETWRDIARAALTEAWNAGVASVPREATEGMIRAIETREWPPFDPNAKCLESDEIRDDLAVAIAATPYKPEDIDGTG